MSDGEGEGDGNCLILGSAELELEGLRIVITSAMGEESESSEEEYGWGEISEEVRRIGVQRRTLRLFGAAVTGRWQIFPTMFRPFPGLCPFGVGETRVGYLRKDRFDNRILE